MKPVFKQYKFVSKIFTAEELYKKGAFVDTDQLITEWMNEQLKEFKGSAAIVSMDTVNLGPPMHHFIMISLCIGISI